jgi:hypothetical protein
VIRGCQVAYRTTAIFCVNVFPAVRGRGGRLLREAQGRAKNLHTEDRRLSLRVAVLSSSRREPHVRAAVYGLPITALANAKRLPVPLEKRIGERMGKFKRPRGVNA